MTLLCICVSTYTCGILVHIMYHAHLDNIYYIPCRVDLVVIVSASRTVGRGFTSRPGHTKDHKKWYRLPLLNACVRLRVV